MQEKHRDINRMIESGEVELALARLAVELRQTSEDAFLYYLSGKAQMKLGNWGKAISDFLHSEQLDEDSPAVESRKMLEDIMQFYNKDMYNQ